MVEKHKERSSFGVLIIHGFTATLDSVKLLYQSIKELGIPVSHAIAYRPWGVDT